jgi:hypothetical protein
MKSMAQSEQGSGCPHLNLNFRGERLETVLDHLHRTAGLLIGIKGNVRTDRTIDLWHDQPVTTAEALCLLKQRLMQIGCTVIQKGAIFSVMRIDDAKKICIALPTI